MCMTGGAKAITLLTKCILSRSQTRSIKNLRRPSDFPVGARGINRVVQTFTSTKAKYLPQLAAKRIFGLIKAEMELVESEYESQANSNIQVINYLGDYIRSSGGKRVRPALLVLSNYSVGGVGSDENVIRL